MTINETNASYKNRFGPTESAAAIHLSLGGWHS